MSIKDFSNKDFQKGMAFALFVIAMLSCCLIDFERSEKATKLLNRFVSSGSVFITRL